VWTVAENPTLTIARILGGVALLNGNLGHQILGQLLITNSNEVAIAGAAAAVAATSGQRNAAAQIAIRTAVPALAVRGLLLKQEQRIERREALVAEREQQFEALTQSTRKSNEAIRKAKQIEQQLTRRVLALEAEKQVAVSAAAALGTHYRGVLAENTTFRTDVLRQSGLAPDGTLLAPKSTRGSKKTSTPRRAKKPPKRKA
jgi:flagellar biosynthesis component FlhA